MAVFLLAVPVAFVGLLWRCAPRRRRPWGSTSTAGSSRSPGTPGAGGSSGCCSEGWRRSALVLGQRVDALGRVTALAPTLLGAGVLLGTIAGELTARPVGRHPPLGRRRDAHPRRDPAARSGRGARASRPPCSSGRWPSARRGGRPTTRGAPAACSAGAAPWSTPTSARCSWAAAAGPGPARSTRCRSPWPCSCSRRARRRRPARHRQPARAPSSTAAGSTPCCAAGRWATCSPRRRSPCSARSGRWRCSWPRRSAACPASGSVVDTVVAVDRGPRRAVRHRGGLRPAGRAGAHPDHQGRRPAAAAAR